MFIKLVGKTSQEPVLINIDTIFAITKTDNDKLKATITGTNGLSIDVEESYEYIYNKLY